MECFTHAPKFISRNLDTWEHGALFFATQFRDSSAWATIDVNHVEDVTKHLVPKIEKVEIVHCSERLDLVVTGLHLESILLRGNPSGFVLSDGDIDRTSLGAGLLLPKEEGKYDFGSIVLDKAGFELDVKGGHMMLARSTQTEARFIFIGLKYLSSSSIKVRTDFGVSNELKIEPGKVVLSEMTGSSIVGAYSFVDNEVLLSAYLRAIISWNATKADKSPEILLLLQDLETILTGRSDLMQLSQSYAGREREDLAFSIVPAARIFNRILVELAKPMNIEGESKAGRFFRKLLAGVGVTVGAVFVVGASIAALPGLILAVPGAVLIQSERPVIGGLLAIPGTLALLPSLAIGSVGHLMFKHAASAQAYEPASLVYIQVLRFLITMLDGNPSTLFEEINIYETAIARLYLRISNGELLEQAGAASVHKTLLGLADEIQRRRDTKQHPILLYKNAVSDSKQTIVRWLMVVGRFSRLRTLMENQLVVSFVGVHNSGKSTAIQKLFGFNTRASALERTESLQVYDIQRPATESLADPLRLTVADFPGTTDERHQIAEVTSRFGSITTLFVAVFTAGHIAAPERQVMDVVLSKGKDYVVIINKCDALGPELEHRYQEFVTNYARILNVAEDRLFFTNMFSPDRIESLRLIIFQHLRAVVPPHREAEVAMLLVNPVVRTQLDTISEKHPNFTPEDLSKAVAGFFKNNQQLSVDRVETFLVQNRDQLKSAPRVHSVVSTPRQLNLEGQLLQPLLAMGYKKEIIALIFDFYFNVYTKRAEAGEDTGDVYTKRAEAGEDTGDDDEPQATVERSTSQKADDFAHNVLGLFSLMSVALEGQNRLDSNAAYTTMYAPMLTVMNQASSAYNTFLSMGYPSSEILLAIRKSLAAETLSEQSIAAILKDLHESADDCRTEELAIAASILSQGESLLRGNEQLNLLKYSVVVSLLSPHAQRVTPRLIFPAFFDAMSIENRIAEFQAKISRRLAAEKDNTTLVELDQTNLINTLIAQLTEATPEQLRGNLKVNLENSEAADLGGVLRGVISGLAQHVTHGESKFFDVLESHEVYFGLKSFQSATECRKMYRAVGRALGISLWHGPSKVSFPVPFSQAVFKLILGQSLSLADLDTIQPQISASLKQICLMNDDDVEMLSLTFNLNVGAEDTYDLIPNGANIDVTGFNRYQYLEQTVRFYLGAHLPLREFVQGVYDVCPSELLCIFTPAMLQIFVCGNSAYTAADMRAHASVMSGTAHELGQMFFDCVEQMTDQDRSLLLTFVTSSSVLPPGGLKDLTPPFTIRQSGSTSDLPVSHTCFNLLDLPSYRTQEEMMSKLLCAIRNVGAFEFGFV